MVALEKQRPIGSLLTVMLLEDQHRPQAHGILTATADVHTELLGLQQELVPLGVVPGDERALALATQVLDLVGVLLREARETRVEVVTRGGGVLDQTEALNLLDDGTEDDGTRRVTHPGIELTVRLVGTQLRVAVVEAGRLRLLGEGHNVRRGLEVPVVVGPELARGANTGLHLVNDEEDVVALRDLAQAAEEGGRGVVVAALGLDGLHHDGRDRVVEFFDDPLDLLQAALLLLGVLLGVLLERVLQGGEGSLGPVKGRDVELVDGLAAGGGKTAKQTAVEGRLERQDRQLRGSGRLVQHGRCHVLLGEFDVRTSALLLTTVDERGLVGGLVGIRASHGGEHLVQALRSDLEDAALQNVCPFSRREVAQGWSVDQCPSHLRRSCRLEEVWVVVSNRNGSNLGIAADTSQFLLKCGAAHCKHLHIEEDVSVQISDTTAVSIISLNCRRLGVILVSNGLLVVSQHVQAPDIKDFVQLRHGCLVLRARNGRLHLRSLGLIWKVGLRRSTEMRGSGEGTGSRKACHRPQPEAATG